MTWQRLEAGHIDPNITEGIFSAIADPLWMLARQWQVGEFRGEDAASPILVDAMVAAVPVADFWVDDGEGRHIIPRDDAPWPLETLVEHEPVAGGPAALRLRLEGGAALAHALRHAGASASTLTAFHDEYPFVDRLDRTLDPAGAAQLALLARRVADGAAVLAALDAAGGDATGLPPLRALDEPTRARLAAAIARWRAQQGLLFCEPPAGQPTAWDSARQEYSFGLGVNADGTIELVAPEYPGGTLDWFHFDVQQVADATTADQPTDAGAVRKHLTSLPTPLQFAGMPAPRWWEFEDRDVSFGDLAAGPDDLARSVLAAYAMVAGEDWLVVPCDLPAGSVARVQQLSVLDNYGDWTPIRSTAEADVSPDRPRVWRYFELSGDQSPRDGRAPLLFLPPVVHAVEQGRPLEHVDFRRDEMANLVWAIERLVESQAGRPVDRHAPRTPRDATPVDDRADELWRHQLATDVPDNWVPLVPVRINGAHAQIALRRGRLAGTGTRAKGCILEPEHAFVMHEEEVPSAGIQVQRRWQLGRGADGAVRLWVGRRKSPGGGAIRRTPLEFDTLTGWMPRA
jgi:hypothetical protein